MEHRYQINIIDTTTQETIYQNDSFAGILCSMDEVKEIGLEPKGSHQTMFWGHILLQMYCYDQLTRTMNKKTPKLIEELEQLGYFKNATIDQLNNWIKGKEQNEDE